MLYLYYGTDAIASRNKMHNAVDALRARAKDADFLTITDETAGEVDVALTLASQGLFYKKRIIVLDHVFSSEHKEPYLAALKDIQTSEHVIFVLEGDLDAKTEKQLTKHAAKTLQAEKREAVKKHFGGFELSDYFAERRRDDLWLAYRKEIMRGEDAHRILGLIFWSAKAIYASAMSETANDAGLKDFPYKKAKGNARRFSQKELARMVGELADLPSKAYRTNTDLEYALEEFILSV